jgi:hypothetical protein
MRCRRAERLLLEHLEHRLDPATDTRVAEHVAVCERCRTQAEAFRATLALIANDTVSPMPVSEERFLQDVRRRVRQQQLPSAGRNESLVLRWIPVSAATAALILVAGILWQLRGTQPVRTVNDLQSGLLGAEVIDVLDPPDTDSASTEVLVAAEEPSFDGIETELADGSDLDDLIDEMAPAEQAELLQGLELVYGMKSN